MNQYVYCEMLEANLYDTFSKYGINATKVICQHDNDPKYTTKNNESNDLNNYSIFLSALLNHPT